MPANGGQRIENDASKTIPGVLMVLNDDGIITGITQLVMLKIMVISTHLFLIT